MHQNNDVAHSASVHSCWSQPLLKAAICVGSLIAGATLISIATPETWLSAGASQSGRLPETVLLDFTAKWCSPCQQMSPIIDRLGEQGYPVMKVDVDQQRALTERFRIDAMPTFVLLVNGREVMRQTGATSEAQLRRMLLQIPTWQQEFARQDAQQKATRTASNATTPSPFSIDLGESESAAPVFAENKPKRGFGGLPLPFMNRDQEKSQVVAAAATPPVIRGQTSDAVTTAPVSHSDPMRASTRLRVKDAGGINYGSGTILESRVGRTLILTCGHIFRHLDDKGIVEVELFPNGDKPVMYIGKVLHFDLDSDVGLVVIPTTEPLSVISLASINEPLQVGDSLRSIGCSGGDEPTTEIVEVTSVNKYDGPDNIECTGLPVPGRSGGGLFRGTELVGICIAADPKDRRGVYTGLNPVYDLLEQTGFGHLLPMGRPAAAPAPVVAEVPAAANPPQARVAANTDHTIPETTVADPAALFAHASTSTKSEDRAATAHELQAVLGQAPDSEIICIVRPKNPQIPSRVVVIHEASPKLVGYLLDSVGSLPDSPGSLNEVLARSEGLVPTTAVDTVSPFAPADFDAPPAFTVPEKRQSPQRPASPRGF